jgi:hypothetical protein
VNVTERTKPDLPSITSVGKSRQFEMRRKLTQYRGDENELVQSGLAGFVLRSLNSAVCDEVDVDQN